jgi:hypothetical protein
MVRPAINKRSRSTTIYNSEINAQINAAQINAAQINAHPQSFWSGARERMCFNLTVSLFKTIPVNVD